MLYKSLTALIICFIFVIRKVLSPPSSSLQKSILDREVKRPVHCDSLAESQHQTMIAPGAGWVVTGVQFVLLKCAALLGRERRNSLIGIAQWPEAAALGNGAVFIAGCL